MGNRVHIFLVLLLLGMVQSYNLDLECFLADSQGCLQVCVDATEDICSEPSVGSASPVGLPPRGFTLEVFLTLSEHADSDFLERTYLSSSGSGSPPVGLRAPPLDPIV